jgi:hypothetical protein
MEDSALTSSRCKDWLYETDVVDSETVRSKEPMEGFQWGVEKRKKVGCLSRGGKLLTVVCVMGFFFWQFGSWY